MFSYFKNNIEIKTINRIKEFDQSPVNLSVISDWNFYHQRTFVIN